MNLPRADPANESAYKANAEAAGERIAALKSWAQQQIAVDPQERPQAGHGPPFLQLLLQGVWLQEPAAPRASAREDEASPKYLAETIKIIRDNNIRAVFPEDQANPKVLAEIVRETGVKVGGELIADGTSPSAPHV